MKGVLVSVGDGSIVVAVGPVDAAPAAARGKTATTREKPTRRIGLPNAVARDAILCGATARSHSPRARRFPADPVAANFSRF
jgi:hypothetical protein